jgi:hypothetical protein
MAGKKTREQRATETARYAQWLKDTGIAAISVAVPVTRVAELRALVAEWRREARMFIEEDRPTADQILQIHAVCWTLGLDLPIGAFETRTTAADWLARQEPRLSQCRVRLPKLPPERA